MVRHIRFHGRGGEGVKLASRIVSRAAFLAGAVVQDSPLYGAERRGAPVVAFTRCSDRPILERGYIERPDAVVIMDHSLLALPEAAVLDGVGDTSLVLANSTLSADALRERYAIRGDVVVLDVSSIALDLLGHHLLSAPIAGFVAKAISVAPWDAVAAAVRVELAEIGVAAALLERNLEATQRAFDAAPAVRVRVPVAAPPPAEGALFVVPRLPARLAAPSIEVASTSFRRVTDGWRVFRPVIDRERCSRCFLCFALCPEGAIHLDADSYPEIDYHHCKGCLVCAAECPPKAIAEVREAAA